MCVPSNALNYIYNDCGSVRFLVFFDSIFLLIVCHWFSVRSFFYFLFISIFFCWILFPFALYASNSFILCWNGVLDHSLARHWSEFISCSILVMTASRKKYTPNLNKSFDCCFFSFHFRFVHTAPPKAACVARRKKQHLKIIRKVSSTLFFFCFCFSSLALLIECAFSWITLFLHFLSPSLSLGFRVFADFLFVSFASGNRWQDYERVRTKCFVNNILHLSLHISVLFKIHRAKPDHRQCVLGFLVSTSI